MLLKRIAIQNVRSFLEKTELTLDGPISVVIGPNGGGKTNLLDIAVFMLRRYVLDTLYVAHAPIAGNQDRYEFVSNNPFDSSDLGPHRDGIALAQLIEVDVEVTSTDLENMRAMRRDAQRLIELASKKYANLLLNKALYWNIDEIQVGDRFTYGVMNAQFQQSRFTAGQEFHQYLRLFEVDAMLRDEYGLSPLTTPLLYLPVNRSTNNFQTSIELVHFNEGGEKQNLDGANSRKNSRLVYMAIGLLAKKHRILQAKERSKT